MAKNDRRVRITLRLYKKGKLVYRTDSSKKMIIFNRIASAVWDKGFIRVVYGKGMENACDFRDLSTFKKALSSYTETSLLNYIYS